DVYKRQVLDELPSFRSLAQRTMKWLPVKVDRGGNVILKEGGRTIQQYYFGIGSTRIPSLDFGDELKLRGQGNPAFTYLMIRIGARTRAAKLLFAPTNFVTSQRLTLAMSLLKRRMRLELEQPPLSGHYRLDTQIFITYDPYGRKQQRKMHL
ncbi:MAG: hypothetical protein MPJ25_08290, partial [Pirellulales bacterium]|nr:hypothetical protein [Pirellulales bacterium]